MAGDIAPSARRKAGSTAGSAQGAEDPRLLVKHVALRLQWIGLLPVFAGLALLTASRQAGLAGPWPAYLFGLSVGAFDVGMLMIGAGIVAQAFAGEIGRLVALRRGRRRSAKGPGGE